MLGAPPPCDEVRDSFGKAIRRRIQKVPLSTRTNHYNSLLANILRGTTNVTGNEWLAGAASSSYSVLKMPGVMYRIESLGRQVGIGVAGSRYVSLSAVAKENSPTAAPYCIPNELICGELARFLRLPVPPVGIVSQASGGPLFASLDFNLTGNTLPPVDITTCVQLLPSLSAGLILFDIWVANCDRHAGNFAVDFLATSPQMNIFDHSHALFGYAAGLGETRLTTLRDRLGISWTTNNLVDSGRHRHCLLDALNADIHFATWMGRIRATPDFYIEEICNDAQPYGLSAREMNAGIAFLKHRRDNLPTIINTNRAEFTGIQAWSLPI